MENLSDTKFFYVIKGCLKNLARAKNALRAQNLKKSIFGTTDFDSPQVPSNIMVKKNWICRCLPNSLKSPQNFLFNTTRTLVVNTKNVCLNPLAGILPQKFLTRLSNSLNFRGCEGVHCTIHFYCKSRDKMLSNELYYRFFWQKLISVAQLKIRCAENFRLCTKNEKKIIKILKCA